MRFSTSLFRLPALIGLFALMACSSNEDLKEKLGLNREGPDEYRVVPRPPLTVPPDFNLRPPGTVESNNVSGKDASERAHEEILGASETTGSGVATMASTAVTPVASGDLPSGADAQFLADAGDAKADPQIRQKLMNDKNGLASSDSRYLIGGTTKGAADAQVDPAKEADRLKTDKSQNLPPTAGGDTPVVPQKSGGLLSNIFGSIF